MGTRFDMAAIVAVLAVVGCAPQGGEVTVSGPEAEAGPEAVDELECFDADYPIEPTFASPEEALEHALETQTEFVTPPGDTSEYERIERAEGWVDFELRASEEMHHTWGVSRDDDGQWGVTSLGGCVPAPS